MEKLQSYTIIVNEKGKKLETIQSTVFHNGIGYYYNEDEANKIKDLLCKAASK